MVIETKKRQTVSWNKLFNLSELHAGTNRNRIPESVREAIEWMHIQTSGKASRIPLYLTPQQLDKEPDSSVLPHQEQHVLESRPQSRLMSKPGFGLSMRTSMITSRRCLPMQFTLPATPFACAWLMPLVWVSLLPTLTGPSSARKRVRLPLGGCVGVSCGSGWNEPASSPLTPSALQNEPFLVGSQIFRARKTQN